MLSYFVLFFLVLPLLYKINFILNNINYKSLIISIETKKNIYIRS